MDLWMTGVALQHPLSSPRTCRFFSSTSRLSCEILRACSASMSVMPERAPPPPPPTAAAVLTPPGATSSDTERGADPKLSEYCGSSETTEEVVRAPTARATVSVSSSMVPEPLS